MSGIPSGNLRKQDTWESFFESKKPRPQPRSSSVPPGKATPLQLASRAGSPERANSPPPPASPTHQLSPAVKHKTAPPSYHIEPVLGKRGTQLTSTIPLSPVNLKTGRTQSSMSLRPHTARSRPVYAGPPGPGQYAPETKPAVLSRDRSPHQPRFAGALTTVDRSKTGPFGKAHASGSAPAPGQYLSQDYGRRPSTQGRSESSFGYATRDVIASKQVDPHMKLAPKGDLSPGPGGYDIIEDAGRIAALDQSLKALKSARPRSASPGGRDPADGSPFSFRPREEGIKYRTSGSKSPAALKIGSTEDRFKSGPFGRIEMIRAGVENPAPSAYNIRRKLSDPAVKSPFAAASSPMYQLGGTAPRSDPMSRNHLYNPSWMPVPSSTEKPSGGPGEYDGAAHPSLGKQSLSTKHSSASSRFPGEKRDARYNYYQPGFTRTDKPFVVPPPSKYNIREVPVGKTPIATKFGTSGRSPVGIVYS